MPDIFEGLDLSPEQQRELETLRKGFAVYNDMVQDKEVRLPLLRRMKAKYPNLNISVPEDDIAAPLIKPIEERIAAIETRDNETLKQIDEKQEKLNQTLAAFEQQRKDEADIRDLGSKIDSAVKKYRFTDEGRAALIEHMKSTNTSDPDTAGAYLVQHMERPQPVTPNGLAPEQARAHGAPDIDLFRVATGQTDDDLKLLHGTPKQQDQWMRQEIDKILAEGIGQEAA